MLRATRRRRPSGRSSPLVVAVSSVERTPRRTGLRSPRNQGPGRALRVRTRGFCYMDVRRARAIGAALTTFALAGSLAAPALASPGVTVSTLSSLRAGQSAGTLGGKVINRTSKAATANVTVRLMRYGTKAPVVGRTKVRVGAGGSASYRVAVRLPAGLAKGNYYL